MAEETKNAPEFNPFQIWADAQKAWTEAWKGVADSATGIFKGAEGAGPLGPMMDSWSRAYRDMTGRLGAFGAPGQTGDTIRRFLDSADAYLKFHRGWMHMIEEWRKKGFSPAVDIIPKMAEGMREMFGRMSSTPIFDMLRPFLGKACDYPEAMCKMGAEASGQMLDAYMKTFVPWANVLQGFGLGAADLLDGEAGPAMYQKLTDSWMKAYESTAGRFFNIPAIGPSRVTVEKFLKNWDAFFKFIGATIDFYFCMYEPGVRAFDTFVEKAKPIFEKEIGPDTFKEFFNLAVSVYEDKYLQMFRSESFTRGLSIMNSNALEFKKTTDDLIETMLKDTPVITRTEMDQVHREVYELKKKIKDLEGKMGDGEKKPGG